ncbi:MAG TPA: hypothetical protein EYP98_06870, partial [Planctomycetes bacterium]|nr:hypothetical protein [Planctomycetota bacterium]
MNRDNELRSLSALLWGVLACIFLSSCGSPDQSNTGGSAAQDPPPSNRIDIPQAVRQNLGIEFIKVERRQITSTLRLPGRIELLPSATQHYRAPLGGRISLNVEPLQKVKPGDLLYTIDSHEWRALQRELGSVTNKLTVTEARLDGMSPLARACAAHESSLRDALKVSADYVESLERAQASVG